MKRQFTLFDFKKSVFSKKLALEALMSLERQGLIELEWIQGKVYWREVEND